MQPVQRNAHITPMQPAQTRRNVFLLYLRHVGTIQTQLLYDTTGGLKFNPRLK
jgi:hypothetical protein